MCPSISHLLSKLVCHSRELLQQFIMDHPLGNGKGVYNVIMHPYTLHSLAKGHSLKYFEPYLNLSSLKVCYILLLCNALGLLFFFPSFQLACKRPVRRGMHSGKDGLFLGATHRQHARHQHPWARLHPVRQDADESEWDGKG